jgi:hypothetical protein
VTGQQKSERNPAIEAATGLAVNNAMYPLFVLPAGKNHCTFPAYGDKRYSAGTAINPAQK